MENEYFAREIENRVTMPEILQMYGFDIGHGNRIPCPIHCGTHRNFGFDEHVYHCFTCGCKGGVITFVRDYFHLNFYEAMKKINQDFSLGIPMERKLSNRERYAMGKKSFQLRKKAEIKRAKKEEVENNYNKALDQFIEYEKNLRIYKPKPNETVLHPKFVEASKNIEYAKYQLECAEMEERKYENGHC